MLEQRIGRIYRLGQTLPIDVYNLVTEEGIEANIAKLLGKKRAVFSTLFDGTSDSVLFDGEGSFMEGVKQLVEAVPLPPLAQSEPSSDEEPLAQLLEAAEPEPEPPAAEPASLPGLSVARLPDGALRIEAPAELAGPLAELLETLARALRGTSPVGGEAKR